MTTGLSDIINVQISRETQPVSRVGFGTPIIVGPHVNWTDRIRFYQNADSVLDDGFSSDDQIYKNVQLAFQQEVTPRFVAVGRRQVDQVNIEIVTTVEDGVEYRVTINDTDFSYTASSTDDQDVVTQELTSQINNDTNLAVTATDNQDGTFTLDNDTAGVAYTVQTNENLAKQELNPSNSITDDLNAINNENDDFYLVTIISKDQQVVIEAAEWVEATDFKIFGTTTADPDVLDPNSTSDLGAELSDQSFDRTFYIWHEDGDTAYPEVAWGALQLTTDPGSTTWAFKTVTGIPSSNLNATERLNLQDKNGNSYETRGGRNIFFEGTMASGEYIDIIRGLDWFKARLTERLFLLLANTPKVPFTNAGITLIENQIRGMVDDGIEQDVIAPTPAPEINIPDVLDIPEQDRANRELRDVSIQFRLAGAIHRVLDLRVTARV